jgi:5'(3')-deoxyribonucleotidase
MKRPLIAVDIDDVLVDHYEALLAFHNARYGTTHTLQDYVTDHWSVVWGTDHAETERRAKEFAALGVAGRAVKAGALRGVQELRKHYDLGVVTVRRKINVEPTMEWLDIVFPDTFREVRFVPIWEESDAPSKAQICQQLGASYLIDDSLKHCELAAAAGVHAVLFGNFPWNQGAVLPAGVTRCKDWAAVLEYFAAQAGAGTSAGAGHE